MIRIRRGWALRLYGVHRGFTKDADGTLRRAWHLDIGHTRVSIGRRR